ncbi:MAG: 1-acyl-sn-glycerol-3-phosphate acyltransferase [Chloroflexi bacterium]|nr:1-acyl-sn-glycerol-3-phosphate acyltransferase [Chloroflexota bacterium]
MNWFARPDLPTERLLLWRLLFPPVRALATAFAPIRLEGREHLPASGPCLLVANHINWYDPPAIEFALGIPIRYMAKRELFAIPIIGFALWAAGNFPVRRGESDRRALETALRVLQAGQPIGFFPEGTRSKDGRMRRAKPGIGFLARRSGAPIVPIAVSGTPQAGIRIPPHADITVRVGPAFTLADLDGRALDDQALADAIMERVAALLPSHMRGHYSDPRSG